MKKLIKLTIILLTIFSCQNSNPLESDKTLTEKIETEFESELDIIDLSELNSFDWGELLILGPYSVIENIEKDLNINLESLGENNIEYSESINLLIFLKDAKPVNISEVSRGIGDFTNLGIMIKKDKAKFVKTVAGENKLVELYP